MTWWEVELFRLWDVEDEQQVEHRSEREAAEVQVGSGDNTMLGLKMREKIRGRRLK